MKNTMHRMKRAPLFLLALLVAAAGCELVSGTLRIEQDILTAEGEQHSTSSDVGEMAVDLSENSDFREHKDQIKSVDEVGFIFHAVNNIPNAATGEIWISPTRIGTPGSALTAATIRSDPNAVKVLEGLALPAAGALDVTYDQSLTLQTNTDRLHEIVKTGTFYLYGIASTSTFDLTISQLTAVVVLTVEL
jgi:hypothetical protein